MHIFIALMFLDVINFILTYFLLRKYNILRIERFILSLMFIFMKYHFNNPALILLSRLYLIDSSLFIIMLCKVDILFLIRLLYSNISELINMGILYSKKKRYAKTTTN